MLASAALVLYILVYIGVCFLVLCGFVHAFVVFACVVAAAAVAAALFTYMFDMRITKDVLYLSPCSPLSSVVFRSALFRCFCLLNPSDFRIVFGLAVFDDNNFRLLRVLLGLHLPIR